MIGQTLGHYEILAELGRGGMGQVFRARDTKLGRDVALKVLPTDVARDTDRLARFQREAQVLAALDCPGIVTVYSVEEDEATHVHFLTMQLVEGQSLDRLLPEHGFPIARFLEIAAALTDALAAAHEKGIVHRDLKPANIMVKGAWGLASSKASAQLAEAPSARRRPTPTRPSDGRLEPTLSALDVTGVTGSNWTVKVLDFGIAKALQPTGAGDATRTSDAGTAIGVVMGTPAYMSPEQIEGHAVHEPSDVFSLGIVLYSSPLADALSTAPPVPRSCRRF